nr:cupin domain-containing protein [Oligoflexus tunisiensis]
MSVSRSEFFRDYWQKKPLFSDNFEPLAFTIKDLNDILGRQSLKPTDIRVVSKENEISAKDMATPRGSLDSHRLLDFFKSGYTIVIPSINKLNRQINSICRVISKDLGASVQANLYYSPSNSQGFKAHWDNHDVLVYQIHGHKTWSVFDQAHCELPLQTHRCIPHELDLDRAHRHFGMIADKILYIPRGFTHFANTDSSPSIHLTFALEYPKLCDILHRMIDSLTVTNRLLRKALPMYEAHVDVSIVSDLAPILSALASPEQIGRELLHMEAKNTYYSDVFDLYFESREDQAAIDAGTHIRVRESAIFSLQYTGDDLTLVMPQRRIAVARSCHYLLFEILSQKEIFCLSDLKAFHLGTEPLALINHLDQLGLFVRASCRP